MHLKCIFKKLELKMSNNFPNIWEKPNQKIKIKTRNNSHLYVESISGIIDLISLVELKNK